MDKKDKHLRAKIGQYVLISNKDNKVLLLERKRSKNWSLPGGRLDKGDKDWKNALEREVFEETGMSIKDMNPFEVKLIEDLHQIKYCVFFTTKVDDAEKLKISSEHDSSKWVNAIKIKAMIIDDEPKVRQVLEHFFTKL